MMLRPMKHVVLRLDLLLSFLGAGGWTLSIRLLLSREKLQRKVKLVGTHVELRHKSFPLTSHISARVYFKRRCIITWWGEHSAPRHSLRFDISFWSAPGERSSHHFKQFYSCINTLFVTVMTLSVFFFFSPPPLTVPPAVPAGQCYQKPHFSTLCSMLCKWFRPPGWKSWLLSHFTPPTAQLRRSNDWADSLSVEVTVGGAEREDGTVTRSLCSKSHDCHGLFQCSVLQCSTFNRGWTNLGMCGVIPSVLILI